MLKKQTTDTIFDPTFTKQQRIAIIRTDYHEDLVSCLGEYCTNTLKEYGVPHANITTFIAPGSWELPLLAERIAESEKFDAIIAFGIIVKGETYHFDMLANEVGRALMDVSLDYGIPVVMEVLAVYDKQHAIERSSANDKNKGIEAATAALKELEVLAQV
jgi:6,7-dimethyl-8-ribityllumazine synthase